MLSMFLEQASGQAGSSLAVLLVEIVVFFGVIYLIMIRPQKKEQKKIDELRNSIQPGDNIMTTGGFYGVVLDVVDDETIIVEFGNNKNCRIPMHRNAIAEVEKDDVAEEDDDEKDSKKK